MRPRLAVSGRVLLAWLAGALLLAGLPGPAAALASASAPAVPAAATSATGSPSDATAVLADGYVATHRAGRPELAGADTGRAELTRQIRSGHGGFGGLADLVPGLAPVSLGSASAVRPADVYGPGSPAPTGLRGRAPPAPGAPRPAGPNSI